MTSMVDAAVYPPHGGERMRAVHVFRCVMPHVICQIKMSLTFGLLSGVMCAISTVTMLLSVESSSVITYCHLRLVCSGTAGYEGDIWHGSDGM